MLTEVWLLCLASDTARFPNLSVLGVFTTRDKAMEVLSTLPKENEYLLYQTPLDSFIGHYLKTGKLKDGMGQLRHEHFESDSSQA